MHGYARASVRAARPQARARVAGRLARHRGDEVHRALPDALTCARVLCALFPRLCANAPTIGDAVALLRGHRRARKTEAHERIPPDQRPDLSTLPDDPGVYIFRDEHGRPLYVGKSISLRTRARAHFCAPAGWTERAEIVDYRPTNSELGALVLENRLIKEWRPGGNRALKRTERYCYLRCRLDIPFPVFDVAAEPAPGHAVNIGPLGSRSLAKELADQLTSLYRLRQCGRKLKLREHPSAYGQMGRCVSPCLGDLDPNAYRRQVDAALAHFEEPGAGERLIEEIDARMREASGSRASSERRLCCAARSGSPGCSSGSTVSCARLTPRPASCSHSIRSSPASTPSGSSRAGSSTGGRFRGATELAERTEAALARPAGRPVIPVEEVDELRIVAGWIADHEPPALELEPTPTPAGPAPLRRRRYAARVGARSVTRFRFSSELCSHELMIRRPASAPNTVDPMLFGPIAKSPSGTCRPGRRRARSSLTRPCPRGR